MYTPSQQILSNYAKVLVNFALNSGEGIKKGEVVYLQFDVPALPLALECYREILTSGAFPIVKMNEEAFSKAFYELASEKQLEFFPKKYMKALVDTIDQRMYLIADRNPLLLKGIDPARIMRANKSTRMLKKWLFDKEDRGRLTWTLALYGTTGMAREAGLSLESYWDQIVRACFLSASDPIKKWKQVFTDLETIRAALSALPIHKLHITGKHTDLWISLGDKRKWMGGSGRNIPSFEIFTSPDWRGTQGSVYFDYPLYRYGNIVRDIHLTFNNGRVSSVKAGKNENLVRELVKQKNADKVGEYSLTDIRFSKITAFMANTLFDENYGGVHGNTHLALGSSYHDAYTGDPKKLKNADWARLGFNDSAEHTDIIGTLDRRVEAVLKDGTIKQIYADGHFTL